MMKCETIIKTISKLEHDLYINYTSKEIKDAIEKCERNNLISTSCDDLISVIYEGVTSDIALDEFVDSIKEGD